MKRNGYVRHTLLGVIMLFSFVITSIPNFLPAFFDCFPATLIAFLAPVCLFEKEIGGGYYGLFAGMLLDLYSVNGGIYSTVALCVLGVLAGLVARHFFVINFYSALTLTAMISFVHLTGYWLVFTVFSGVQQPLFAYVRQTLPTILYTVVFVVIFYPLVKFICLKHTQRV